MHVRPLTVALALAAAFGPAAVRAGPLVSATWTQSIQGVEIMVTNSGAACTDTNPARVSSASVIVCPSAGLQATGSSTGTSYNVSLTMPRFQMQVFTTASTINIATMGTLSGAQNIIGGSASATATTGIVGMVTIGGAQHTMGSMWAQPVMGTVLALPLSVGKAGGFTNSCDICRSPFYITVDFYNWTPGTFSFTGLSLYGMALPDVIAMGTFGLTANGGGSLTLVSPSKIAIDNALTQRRTVSFATLKLSFVPEPAALLLLGAGALALLRFVRRS